MSNLLKEPPALLIGPQNLAFWSDDQLNRIIDMLQKDSILVTLKLPDVPLRVVLARILDSVTWTKRWKIFTAISWDEVDINKLHEAGLYPLNKALFFGADHNSIALLLSNQTPDFLRLPLVGRARDLLHEAIQGRSIFGFHDRSCPTFKLLIDECPALLGVNNHRYGHQSALQWAFVRMCDSNTNESSNTDKEVLEYVARKSPQSMIDAFKLGGTNPMGRAELDIPAARRLNILLPYLSILHLEPTIWTARGFDCVAEALETTLVHLSEIILGNLPLAWFRSTRNSGGSLKRILSSCESITKSSFALHSADGVTAGRDKQCFRSMVDETQGSRTLQEITFRHFGIDTDDFIYLVANEDVFNTGEPRNSITRMEFVHVNIIGTPAVSGRYVNWNLCCLKKLSFRGVDNTVNDLGRVLCHIVEKSNLEELRLEGADGLPERVNITDAVVQILGARSSALTSLTIVLYALDAGPLGEALLLNRTVANLYLAVDSFEWDIFRCMIRARNPPLHINEP